MATTLFNQVQFHLFWCFQKSKNDKVSGSSRRSSNNSPGMTRLDPMPGLPVHSSKLNQLDPIPPTKKFVR